MIYGNAVGGSGGGIDRTFIIEDAEGNELVGIVVGEEIVFTATENDIRKGTVAATQKGVTEGAKEIPSYHTTEGWVAVPVGSELNISIKRCEFTKLQVLICRFSNSIAESVATEKVSIDGKVYNVESTESIADVTVDANNQIIKLGISNDGDIPYIMRYFTYKEEH